MLIATGTMITCLNMLLSQLYEADEVGKRQSGFLWNYSSMNIGFILGCSIAGYYQLKENYAMLFSLLESTISSRLAFYFCNGNTCAIKIRFLVGQHLTIFPNGLMIGISIILLLVPALHELLSHTEISDDI